MTLKQYLAVMFFATVVCWIAWGLVITNIDPFQADVLGFIFFYSSLFFSILGTMSIFVFLVRRLFAKGDQPVFRHVKKSFHDAFFISAFLLILLYLQSQNYLHWWNAGVLAGIFLFYMIFLWSAQRTQKNKTLEQ